jgi:hypothetical protein
MKLTEPERGGSKIDACERGFSALESIPAFSFRGYSIFPVNYMAQSVSDYTFLTLLVCRNPLIRSQVQLSLTAGFDLEAPRWPCSRLRRIEPWSLERREIVKSEWTGESLRVTSALGVERFLLCCGYRAHGSARRGTESSAPKLSQCEGRRRATNYEWNTTKQVAPYCYVLERNSKGEV